MKKFLYKLIGWVLEITLMTLAMMYPWQAFIGLIIFIVGLPTVMIIVGKIFDFFEEYFDIV